MKILYSSIKHFLEKDFDIEELCHNLTMKGFEVESLEKISSPYMEQDYLIEVNVTPNRMDCLSIFGLAREISYQYNIKINDEKIKIDYIEPQNLNQTIPITIQNPELCGLYIGTILENVKVKESPEWLKTFLEIHGFKSINNVVDITNYILLMWGQPLHAFDLNKLEGPEIIVRNAKEDEKIITLDGKERILNKEILVIADKYKPCAIAGIIGGEESSIKENTRTILLEAAWFLPQNIRKSAKKLKISTESSYRFERGVDPEETLNCAKRAVKLLIDLCDAKQVSPFIKVKGNLPIKQDISLNINKVNSYIGLNLDKQYIVDTLKRIEIITKEINDETIICTPPLRRFDITEDVDLIEEITRLYGYDNITPIHPTTSIKIEENISHYNIINSLKKTLSFLGLNETINYSFTNPDFIDKLRLKEDDIRKKFVKIQNPLTIEQSVMRTIILPQLLENIRYNIYHNIKDLKLYEIGRVFYNKENELPDEKTYISVVITGRRYPKTWAFPPDQLDFYDIKGIFHYLIRHFPNAKIKLINENRNDNFMSNQVYQEIQFNDKKIGFIGEIDEKVLKTYDINQKVYALELEIDDLINTPKYVPKFTPIPKYPGITRDNAIVLSKSLMVESILDFIEKNKMEYLKSVEIFDVYTGKNIDEDKKSVGFKFFYQSDTKTLTEEEVDSIHNNLLDKIFKTFNAKLREK